MAVMNGTNRGGLAGLTTKPQPLTQIAPVTSLNSSTSVASPGGALSNSNAARLHTLPASVSIIQTPTASSAAVTSTAPNKAASPAASMGVANSAKTTPTSASSPTTTAKDAKKVIDIVDLSDDEDQTAPRYKTFISQIYRQYIY